MASRFGAASQKSFAFPWRVQAAHTRQWLSGLILAEQGRWVLFTPVAFGGGIALWFLLPWVEQRQAALVGAMALAVFGLAYDGLLRRILLCGGLLLAAGLLTAEWRSIRVAAPTLNHWLTRAPVTGTVEQVERRAGGDRTRILLRRDASDIDPSVRVRISMAGEPPEFLRPGVRITIPATLMPVGGPLLPGGYDPRRRAWFEGLAATGRATGPPQLLAPAEPGIGGAWLAGWRGDIATFLETHVGGDAGAVAVALTVGEQGQVDPDLIEAMRVSGLAHLLTVSGFHIAVVVGGVMLVGRRLLALWPWLALRVSVRNVAAILGGVAGTFYVLLSGADVPAVRAGIMAWVVVAALLMGRDPLSLRLLAFAACVILAFRPESLMNPGFQLSFAAVAALIRLGESRVGKWMFRRPVQESWWHWCGRHLAALLLTGLAAELVLSPIALSHFGRAGVYGVFANLLAIPWTGFVIMPLLALTLALGAIGLGGLSAPLMAWTIDGLNGIATEVAAWPGASLAVPTVPLHAYALGVTGALILGLFVGRLRWLGAPLLLTGIGLALWWPRPDMLIGADGRQVAVVSDGGLYTLRGHRGGFAVRSWAEAAAAPPAGRIGDLSTARCNDYGCVATVGARRPLHLLALTEGRPTPDSCLGADIVVSVAGLADCTPRWLKLDRATLVRLGAVAIHADSRRFDSVAAHAGDHPWSPVMPPGQQMLLTGRIRWTGVLAE
ncbi:MAG: ComEC/Rec2 family competence protein [Sphingomonadaceae bacterium]